MINDPYQPILSEQVGSSLALAINFGVPFVAGIIGGEMKRHRWLPHAVAILWEIVSLPVFGFLMLPRIPAGEAPGPGDGFALLFVALSVFLVLMIYCGVAVVRLLRFVFTPHAPREE